MSAAGGAGHSPAHGHDAQYLEDDVRREHEEPCKAVGTTELAEQGLEEFTEAIAAITAEYGVADEEDGQRQERDADHGEYAKEQDFPDDRVI